MTTRPSAVSRQVTLLAALLVALGAAGRLYDLDRMVVWHDEVFTAMRVFGHDQNEVARYLFSGRPLAPGDLLAFQRPAPERGWSHTLQALTDHPEHSPLYYLAARAAAHVVDDPLLALRGTSALLSILLIPAVFWLARELFPDRKVAWLAAVLVALSPLHLLYAQEAREYALWAGLAAASSAAYLRALRSGVRADWLLYGLLIAVGLYAHLLSVLVVAAHLLYGMALRRGEGDRLTDFAGRMGRALLIAAALFIPWILVLIDGSHRVEQVTGWMARDIGPARVFEAWGMHLVRSFADVPALGHWLLVGLLPLGWWLSSFAFDGPRSALLFCVLLFTAFALVVLLPDLLLGGSRSLHPRYALPGLVAVELAVAWALAAAWDARSAVRRRSARVGLLAVIGAALYSGSLILRAETWWSKNFSAQNRAVARLMSAAERPLILVADSGVGLGEIISLSYDLDQEAVIWGMPDPPRPVPADGFGRVFALTPSESLRAALGPERDLVPVSNTWQWFQALERASWQAWAEAEKGSVVDLSGIDRRVCVGSQGL
jgi:uncharacterized membrane protein